MIVLSLYQGIGQFGPAYQIMLENDIHAPGSVDRVLLEHMIRLCPETADYLYGEYTPTQVRYQKGSRPELESYVEEAISNCHSVEEQIKWIVSFTSSLGAKEVEEDLDSMRFGGIEEEIIYRGSDWCTDIARVGCVLCQVAGFPSRIAILADTDRAYSGHDIIEVYRDGVWGAVDTTTAVIYRHLNGRPASVWELMNQPQLIEAHKSPEAYYTSVGQFRSAAIVDYFVWNWKEYDYSISVLNGYHRSILEMSNKGWPGGLRWIHGEDKA